ncbi:hypothetical protein J6590_099986 [Homalodisca vitripennis]|nr:hypothetical protein J6590_099986 [Homalodisca vitripennis]
MLTLKKLTQSILIVHNFKITSYGDSEPDKYKGAGKPVAEFSPQHLPLATLSELCALSTGHLRNYQYLNSVTVSNELCPVPRKLSIVS